MAVGQAGPLETPETERLWARNMIPGNNKRFALKFAPNAGHGFSQLPNDLIRNAGALGLTGSEVALVWSVLSYKWNGSPPFPSKARIAEHLGWSNRKVQRVTRSLTRKGHLRRKRRPECRGKWIWDFDSLFSAAAAIEAQKRAKRSRHIPGMRDASVSLNSQWGDRTVSCSGVRSGSPKGDDWSQACRLKKSVDYEGTIEQNTENVSENIQAANNHPALQKTGKELAEQQREAQDAAAIQKVLSEMTSEEMDELKDEVIAKVPESISWLSSYAEVCGKSIAEFWRTSPWLKRCSSIRATKSSNTG